jgi:hypothetical protein
VKLRRLQLVEIEVLALLGLVALCFGCSLTSYFLADDIWQVNYISKIAAGQWDILLRNFVGNFLDIPSSALYRPLVVVSMVFDFFLWKTNSIGWFATNLLLYTANVFLVFFLARTLKSEGVADVFPFFCASLFAVYPLHCEPVCWLAGRSDLICTFWFLLSFIFCGKALLRQSKRLKIFSLASFVFCLLSKEMSIVLPAVASILAFLWAKKPAKMVQRLRFSIFWSSPYWLMLAVYFVLRLKFLGTLMGGYTDAVGLVMQSTWLVRLTDWKNVFRIFYPFRDQFFLSFVGIIVLTLAYIGSVLQTRLSNASKELILMVFWLTFSILPILPMWGLGPNLEAGRIYFLASVPLCMLLGLFLAGIQRKWARNLCLFCIAFFWSISARDVSEVWAAAGAEVRNLCSEAVQLCKSKSGKFAILPLPKEKDGALLLTNGGMFLKLLQPPYNSDSFTDRFIVFDRVFTEPDYLIDPIRFRGALQQADVTGPYLWKNNGFHLISYVSSLNKESAIKPRQIAVKSRSGKTIRQIKASEKLSISNVPEPQYLEITDMLLCPFDVDFLQFRINTPEKNKTHFAYVSWGTPNFSPVRDENGLSSASYECGSKIVTVPLSNRWKWFATPKISAIRVALPDVKMAEIEDLQLITSKKISPKIEIKAKPNALGLFYLRDESINLTVDSSEVKGSQGILMQVSKCNFFFESFSPDRQSDAVETSMDLKSSKANFTITPSICRQKGYYQLRCRALNRDGNPLGMWSNCVIVYRP